MKESVAAATPALGDGLRGEFGGDGLVADIRLAPDKDDKAKVADADVAAAVA